ncbi:uncharacterized protein LOC141596741 [Silene latifolia]|uniref:uncharacterized protein LOC141596741 n=1 Tax=Silene latifolia TaxID=37657 RepID=UPI003D788FE5
MLPNLAWKIGFQSNLNVWTSKWVNGNIPRPRDVTMLNVSPSLLDLEGYSIANHRLIEEKGTEQDKTRLFDGGRMFIKKSLWHFKGPSKWKILIWKIMTDTLPVGAEIQKRNIAGQFHCRFCEDEGSIETTDHLFRDCPISSRLWKASSLGINTYNDRCVTVKQWIVNWLHYFSGHKDNDFLVFSFICLVQAIWIARNKIIFNGEQVSIIGIIKMYESELGTSLVALNSVLDTTRSLRYLDDDNERIITRIKKGEWNKFFGESSNCETRFVCVDAAWKDDLLTGIGWSVSSLDSFSSERFVGNRFHYSTLAESAEQAEAIGIRQTLIWAKESGFLHLAVSSDCLQVILQIFGVVSRSHCSNAVILDILDLCPFFHCISFRFIPRSLNRLAHNIARRVRLL